MKFQALFHTLLASCIALLALTPAATWGVAAATQYTITGLGTLAGPASRALDINNRGEVVGASTTAPGQTLFQAGTHAFLWRNGAMIDLGTLGGATSLTRAINDNGQIAGNSQIAGGPDAPDHAFLWENGKMIDLGTLGGPASVASAINNRGQIVGFSTTKPGETGQAPGQGAPPPPGTHAFLWEQGTMIDLGTLGGPASRANGINNRGQVVGRSQIAGGQDAPDHAFLWENGKLIDLGTLPGGTNSAALRINDHGQVVGSSSTEPGKPWFAPGAHAFLWENGRMIDLGVLPGFGSSFGAGLNNRGQVTGHTGTGGPSERGFVWEAGVMTDLNSLLPANSGWTLTFVPGINNAGQIIGGGLFNGQEQAFLLTPANDRPLPNTGVDGAPVTFPETGYSLEGEFLRTWETNGGLPVFGYPIASARQAEGRVSQWLERARFELHTQNAARGRVLLGRLGVEVLEKQGRTWQSFAKASPGAAHYFKETGHAISYGPFWSYWSSHGLELDGRSGISHAESLALFGYPISEVQVETNANGERVLTQWFERTRFEYHPRNPAAYRVLLGHLGAELRSERGR
jgi:probable HAF family extracellular repeat protein